MMGKKPSMKPVRGLVDGICLTEKFKFNPKEGIDNPVMVIADGADSVSTFTPRLCVLKREEGESYGFNLRVERICQGHVIRHVASRGIAEWSGLRDGDRLLEVNNSYIVDAPHSEVVRKIKLGGHQLCLLVLDGEEYEQAVSQGQDLEGLVGAFKDDGCKPPRLCHISRDPASGLGISFTPVEGERGRFSVNLVKGGAAEKAGVCKGDRLVWMNGAMVSDLTNSALSKMIKICGNQITILVVDSESEQKYIQKRMPILPTMAVPHNLPYRARKLHMVSGPDGYGFLLRQEEATSGRRYHVLREIDLDSPAENAGMRDGELLLEVNGEMVESLEHDEVVDRVKLNGRRVSLTTITMKGMEFYSQLGLSPLLYCEEKAAKKESAARKESTVTVAVVEQPPPKETDGPRLCSIQKGTLGFGFNLGCVPKSLGTFISQVTFGGPGQRAGLDVGDVVVEVNGQNVEEKHLEDVIMLVREGGHSLSLLVVDMNHYNKTKKADKPNVVVTDTKDDDGYELTYL